MTSSVCKGRFEVALNGLVSHDSDFVGNLEGVVLLGEHNVGLLVSVGADEGVNLAHLDAVHVLDGSADHGLGGSLVNKEHKGVVVLNGLDGGLGREGVVDHGELVHSGLLLDGVLDGDRLAGGGKSLGESEGGVSPDLGLGGSVGSLLHSSSGSFSSLKTKNKDMAR